MICDVWILSKLEQTTYQKIIEQFRVICFKSTVYIIMDVQYQQPEIDLFQIKNDASAQDSVI